MFTEQKTQCSAKYIYIYKRYQPKKVYVNLFNENLGGGAQLILLIHINLVAKNFRQTRFYVLLSKKRFITGEGRRGEDGASLPPSPSRATNISINDRLLHFYEIIKK